MKPQELSIREYVPGDESGILKLFREVFGKTRTVAEWNWEFNDAMHGMGWIVVGTMDHQIVGHSAITRADLNFKGKRIAGGQACDAMIHASIRGKRVYTETRKRCYELAAAGGLEAVYCFPNRLAYPLMVQKPGWYKVVKLSYFFRRIGLRRLWGPKADQVFKFLSFLSARLRLAAKKLRYGKSLEITVSASLPDDVEDLLRDTRAYEVIAVWKDLDYLRWRYENHPACSYTFHLARSGGTPRGLLITRDCGDTIAVCELIHRDNDEVPSLLLVGHVVNHYIRSRAQKIEFYGHDAGFFQFVFASCGFRTIPFSPLVCAGRVFSNPDLEKVFLVPDNWTIVYGDTDVI